MFVVGVEARRLLVSECRIAGLSTCVIVDLVAELGLVWRARRDAELLDWVCRRAVGAGAKFQLVFVDRLGARLVHLWHGVTHDVLACWFQVDRSTISRAATEVLPLLADCGCRIERGAQAPDPRRCHRPPRRQRADRAHGRHRNPGPQALGPPQRTQRLHLRQEPHQRNESPVTTSKRGPLLFCGEVRAGSVADVTQAHGPGLVDLLADSTDLHSPTPATELDWVMSELFA